MVCKAVSDAFGKTVIIFLYISSLKRKSTGWRLKVKDYSSGKITNPSSLTVKEDLKPMKRNPETLKFVENSMQINHLESLGEIFRRLWYYI